MQIWFHLECLRRKKTPHGPKMNGKREDGVEVESGERGDESAVTPEREHMIGMVTEDDVQETGDDLSPAKSHHAEIGQLRAIATGNAIEGGRMTKVVITDGAMSQIGHNIVRTKIVRQPDPDTKIRIVKMNKARIKMSAPAPRRERAHRHDII